MDDKRGKKMWITIGFCLGIFFTTAVLNQFLRKVGLLNEIKIRLKKYINGDYDEK